MFSIIGIVVVFGCIVAGYLMEHGNIKVLLQPAELIIIGGAALGTVLISNPVHTLQADDPRPRWSVRVVEVQQGPLCQFLEDDVRAVAKGTQRRLVALETDIEEPSKSPLFSAYKDFVSDHHAVDFVCDTMRMAVSGGVEVFDLTRCWKPIWTSITKKRASRFPG